MSVDAKLFVTCGKDKLFEVVNAVVSQLNVWVRAELDTYWKTHTDAVSRPHFLMGEDYVAQSEMFTNGVCISAYDMNILSIHIRCGNVNYRMLNTIPDCNSDYRDTYAGDKVTFSLVCWGKSDEIMQQVAIAVAQFGDVYYDHNDCDDEDPVLIGKQGEIL